ncbi:14253_t:CDS:2 [Entrophospora sp. SA101]|nr:5567_t:CDS:2 [Entrophospora sp. SA101]CAJ0835004.1 14253_t:CDS:2 [Entrophospora sp. SA101]
MNHETFQISKWKSWNAKAEKNLTSTVTDFLAGIIQLPLINVTEDGVDFICPGTGPTSSLEGYTSFFSQAGTFIPIAGLLFTIVVYGAKSIFGIMTTCLIDDIVIATTSFAPIFWWYTFAKPLWFYGVIHEIQGDLIYDVGLINSITIVVLLGTMIIVQTFGAIIRFHFHKHRNELKKDSIWFQMLPAKLRLNNKDFFSALKTMFIWGYFLHSVEVIVYSFLTYKYIFSTYFKQFDQLNSDNGSKVVVFARQINLLFLNYFINFCYLFATVCLVATYHFPNLEKYIFCITGKKRRYSGFVLIECTYKHGGDEKVYAEIKIKNIHEVVYFYYQKNKSLDEWTRCRFGSAGEYFYICEEKDKDEGKNDQQQNKDKKFQNIRRFFLNVSKYLFGQGVFESGPILEEIKKITGADTTCPLHLNCEIIKGAMEKNIEHGNKTTGKNEEEKDGPTTIKVKRMETENKVRINILETGALNYLIYSHRKDSKEDYVAKKKYEFEISDFYEKC